MGLRLSLDLLDLDQAFVAVARGGPGGVDGASEAVQVNGVHPAIAHIGIVRDGQQLITGFALRVHPLPQVFGMPGVQSAVGHRRHVGAVTEKDIAVQVPVVRGGGVSVRAERRELAGVVVFVGDLYVFFPDRAGHLGAHQSFHRRFVEHIHEVVEHLSDIRRVIGVLENQTAVLRATCSGPTPACWLLSLLPHIPSGRLHP